MNPGEPKRTVVLQGLGVSSGVAIGVAHLVRRIDAPISRYQIEDKSLVPEEIRRFRKAIKDSENQLLEIERASAAFRPVIRQDDRHAFRGPRARLRVLGIHHGPPPARLCHPARRQR